MSYPYILVKNRKQLVEEQEDKFGYNFCQRCGKSRAFKFEVHHIVFRSEAQYHPELHNKRNLIIVCDKCHKQLHNKKSLRNPLIKSRKLNELFDRELER